MSWISDLPVQRKLGYAMLLTSTMASVVACGVFLAVEYIGYRRSLVHTVATLARISADNSTAAIAFADKSGARLNLEALRAEPQIIRATLYDANGQVFARYNSRPEEPLRADTATAPGVRLEGDYVVAVQPVAEGSRRLGTLYLHASMAQIYERMRNYSFVVAGVLAASFGLAGLLASLLRRTIARPILELASTAEAISTNQDYSRRARHYGRDELGQLTTTFNAMLDRTQAAVAGLRESEWAHRELVRGLPTAAYMCDPAGMITLYNEAAVALWGRAPELGREYWCGSYKIFRPDGTPLPLDECPMAVALREGRPVRGVEIIVERPDGTRRNVLPHPEPIRDTSGKLVGIVNMLVDITEQKRAGAVARQLAAIVESSHDAIVGKDLHSTVTSWNRGAELLFGYTAAEMIGQSIIRLIPADNENEEPGILERIRRGESIEHYETVRRRKDGTLIDVSLTVSPIKDATGKVTGASKIARDISARKRAEAVAAGQRLTLQLIAEDAALGVVLDELVRNMELAAGGGMCGAVLLAREGRLRAGAAPNLPAPYSAGLDDIPIGPGSGPCATAAWTKEPVYVAEIAHETQWPEFKARALAHGLQACWSTPILSSQGEVLGTFSMYYPMPRQPTSIELKIVELAVRTAVIAIENKRAAAALRASEGQLRLVTDNAPVLLVRVDREHRYLFVNRAYAERNGFKPADMIGRHVAEAVGPAAYASFKPRMDEALAGRRVEFEMEVPYDRLGRRWIHVIYVPEKDPEGKITGLLAVITDMGARKEAEIELKRARDEAVTASRAKDDFLAALSHELRTPLNPVLLLASDAARNPDLPPAIRADFDLIRKNVDLEARLIDDLLDLTRITRGKLTLDQRRCNVHTVLRDALANVRPDLAEKQLRLQTDFAAEKSFVLGDAVRLQQVFWNVLKNAVKFTPEKGGISVTTALVPGADRLAIHITDSGIGMTEEEMQRAFQPFAQGDHASQSTTTHRFGGLGLGLAISRLLVDLHAGRIQASSAGRDRGSTFVIELPLYQKSAAKPNSASPESSAHVPVDSGPPVAPLAPRNGHELPVASQRILLVEDHAPTRLTLQQLLRNRHHQVTVAESAARATQLALTDEFDLIISDVGLPDRSGYELMADLRSRHPLLRGIALSGYGMEEDLQRSRTAGFAIHLVKPVTIGTLEDAMASLFAPPAATETSLPSSRP